MPKRVSTCLIAICLLISADAVGQEILTRAPAAEPDSTTLAPPPVTGLAAAPAQPMPGQVWQPVLVVTDEGWHLPDCSLRWLDDGSRVRVTRADGSWRDFLPWTVTSVFAEDGTDLTATIAAARPGGVRSTPPLPGTTNEFNEIGAAPPAAGGAGGGLSGGPANQPFSLALTVGGGYAAFVGDWYSGFDDSPSLQAALRLGTGPNTWVTLGYRRQGGDSLSDRVYDYPTDSYLPIRIDLRVDEFMLLVGKRANGSAATPHVAYVEFGLVALNHVANADLSYYGYESYSEFKLGAVAQFGGLFALDTGLVLDLGVDVVIKPGFFDEYESSGFIFGLHAGIGYISW